MNNTVTKLPTKAPIQIERGIPVPKVSNGRSAVYPFATMEVGDSFFVPYAGEPKKKVNARIYTAMASALRRLPDHRMISRAVDGGRRIWRVS